MLAVSYSVLFRQSPFDQLDALAPIVAAAYRVTDFDARGKIRKGWGFLERNATGDEARVLAEAIGSIAGGLEVIDNANLRAPAEPQVTKGFAVEADGIALQLQAGHESVRVLSWADIAIVAAGGFTEEIIRRESGGDEQKVGKMLTGLGVFLVTGIPMNLFGGGKKKAKEAKPAKSSRLITFGRIVTRAGEQFAFSPDHFDFSGLGDKKQMHASANFRAFLADLSERTSAKLNLGAQLLLGNRSVSFANYSGVHDFETELLWLMNTG